MFHKKALWQGLTCVFALLLALSIAVMQVLETFRTSVDRFLNTTSSVVVSDDDGDLYSVYKPTADVLTADGKGDSAKLIQKAVDINRRELHEGSVLLKNNNAVLPLKKDSGKVGVTLLGIRSAYTLLGSEKGVTVKNGQTISLADALSKNRTNFSGIANFEFDGAGFDVNNTMLEAYTAANNARTTNKVSTIDNIASATDNVSGPFDAKEASLEELAAVSPNYEASFASYNDAAIVVLGRPSTENQDYLKGKVVDNFGADEPLQLSKNERDILNVAKSKFDKVIVLINTNSAMEIDELKKDDGIDAILWIGHPGAYGCLGVADVLCGKANPSGGLYDIYAADNLSAPAMMNMGWYRFTNNSKSENKEITRESQYSDNYVIEAEGIYVGYRYYETRYNDAVLEQGNASSAKGAYASSGGWNYSEEVTYGFGYGLSYTNFKQELVGKPVLEQKAHEMYMTFTVNVTNTGNAAGAVSVQIYGQSPYIHGETKIEKSAIQLLGFEKTKTIQPGKSQTVKVEVDLANLASYDSTVENADGTKGTYVFENGDYYFAVGYDNAKCQTGAHEALNNILAEQGHTPDSTGDRMTAAGDAELAYKWNYKYAGEGTDTNTFGISKNNRRVSNQLKYADYNYYDDKITYLSRNDWDGTYPIEYGNPDGTVGENSLTAPQSMLNDLNGRYYEVKTNQDTSEYKFGNTDTDYKLYEMVGSEWDDNRWDSLLNQMSIEESLVLAAVAGDSIAGISSVGLVEQKITVNAGNGLDEVTLGGTQVKDAHWAISADDPNAGWFGIVFASSPVAAATFNPDLMNELGEYVGLESLFVGIPILWGPGLNTHRHAYNGRNGEYYSEDPVLSGVIAMEYAMGAKKNGLIIAPKHFAFNDQETKRKGLAPFMSEQRAREVELRAYQIPIEATKYDRLTGKDEGMLGLMISFSKIGPVECTCSRGLLTEILQNEWGFHGYATTDIFDDPNLFSAELYAGITGVDFRGITDINMSIFEAGSIYQGVPKNQIDGKQITSTLYNGDADILSQLRNANKRTLYVLAQSNLINKYNASVHTERLMTWWRATYISAITITAVLTAGGIAMYVVSVIKGKKEETQNG